jgi:hypothetical protein
MTETVTCARCHCTFEKTCVEEEDGSYTVRTVPVEAEPVCNECEHEFLAWTGCPPIC